LALQRVEILSNNIIVQFDRVAALASWRGANPDRPIARDREVVDQRREFLGSGETLTDDGERLTLSLPVRARFRGGRAAILHPREGTSLEPRLDMALVKALARAHRWCRMLLGGEVASIDALAARHRTGPRTCRPYSQPRILEAPLSCGQLLAASSRRAFASAIF